LIENSLNNYIIWVIYVLYKQINLQNKIYNYLKKYFNKNMLIKNYYKIKMNICSIQDYEIFKQYQNDYKYIIALYSGDIEIDEVITTILLNYYFESKNIKALFIRTSDSNILLNSNLTLNEDFIAQFIQKEKLAKNKIYNIRAYNSKSEQLFDYIGYQVIEHYVKLTNPLYCIKPHQRPMIMDKIFNRFISNSVYEECFNNGHKKYENLTTLRHIVERIKYEELSQEGFMKAVDIVLNDLDYQFKNLLNLYLPSYEIVRSAINKRKEIHYSGAIIVLEEKCFWKDHLRALEKEMLLEGRIKYVIYFADNGFKIQAIPLGRTQFSFRKGLFYRWRGLPEDELIKASGIKDIQFIHVQGYIGGAKSKESAIQIAEMSLYDKFS
jgi:uncharacterized UPF0160 family protein